MTQAVFWSASAIDVFRLSGTPVSATRSGTTIGYSISAPPHDAASAGRDTPESDEPDPPHLLAPDHYPPNNSYTTTLTTSISSSSTPSTSPPATSRMRNPGGASTVPSHSPLGAITV